MDRRVWQATVHGVSKESEMTERLSLSFSHLYMTTGKTIALLAKWCLCFSIHCLGLSQLFFQGASIFYFVVAVTISSDFGAQENSLSQFPILPLLFAVMWRDWMPSSSFSECWVCSLIFHSSFTFIKRLCSSSSVQFRQFSRSVVYDSLRHHELFIPTPGVHSNSCPSNRWCHPTISSLVIPFSSCPQSLPTSESFRMSQLFAWGGQSIGVSALASVFPKNTHDWSPLEWIGWISLQSKGFSRAFSNTTVQKHKFFDTQLSSQSNSHIHTWLLEKSQPWLDGLLLTK